MSAQTSYEINLEVALAGNIYALSPRNIVSFAAETTTAIEFGTVVSRGTDADNQAVAGGAVPLGIVVRELAQEGAANTGAINVTNTETLAIMREGYIWAICPAGCVPNDQVTYDAATGVVDAGGVTDLTGARWYTTAAAGELAVISIDI